MKLKIIIISLLTVSIISFGIYYTFTKDGEKETPIEEIEVMENKETEEEEVIFPEIEIKFDEDDDIKNSEVQVEEIETEDSDDVIPSLNDEILQEKQVSDYITIDDDERINVGDDGSISIEIKDVGETKTESIEESKKNSNQ